jgi:hypothetical protein
VQLPKISTIARVIARLAALRMMMVSIVVVRHGWAERNGPIRPPAVFFCYTVKKGE